jgi:integrase/recombinase XerC
MDLARAAAIMREATKDKSYQLFPMGQEAAAYLRMKRKRLTDSSYRDYERGLDKLARFFPDLELRDFEPPVGTERIEEFLDAQYGGSSPRNYNKNLSILRDFFKYQVIRGKLHGDPTLAIERARARQVYRTTFTNDQRRAILAEAEDQRDRIALRLLLDYGLRKGALKSIQFKHFDHARRQLTIFTKGGKVRPMPIPDPKFWNDLAQLEQPIGPAEPSHYLMAVDRKIPVGSPDAWGRRTTETRRNWEKSMSDPALHRWWYRRLAAAGIVATGQTSGERMHKARHTAGQRVLDHTGNIKAAQKLLGHASIQTTADIYTDWDIEQLTATMQIVLEEDDD